MPGTGNLGNYLRLTRSRILESTPNTFLDTFEILFLPYPNNHKEVLLLSLIKEVSLYNKHRGTSSENCNWLQCRDQ